MKTNLLPIDLMKVLFLAGLYIDSKGQALNRSYCGWIILKFMNSKTQIQYYWEAKENSNYKLVLNVWDSENQLVYTITEPDIQKLDESTKNVESLPSKDKAFAIFAKIIVKQMIHQIYIKEEVIQKSYHFLCSREKDFSVDPFLSREEYFKAGSGLITEWLDQ